MAPKASSKASSRAVPTEKRKTTTAPREGAAAPQQNKKQKVVPPKFASEAAKERFEMVKKKKYLPERAIDAEKIKKKYKVIWRDLVESRAWGPLFAPAGPANLTKVHELYANWGDTLGVSCTVRDKEVTVTAQALDDFLGVPHVTGSVDWKLQCDYTKVREVVCGNNKRAKWRPKGRSKHHELPYRYFTKEARVYLNFICNRLMPCKHFTYVRRSRVFLTYALMMHIPIDVGSLMIQEMQRTLRWPRCRLFFANTLTGYMQRLGVPNQTLDRKMPAEAKVANYATVRGPDVSVKLQGEQKFDVLIESDKRKWAFFKFVARKLGVTQADIDEFDESMPFSADARAAFGLDDTEECHPSDDELTPAELAVEDDESDDDSDTDEPALARDVASTYTDPTLADSAVGSVDVAEDEPGYDADGDADVVPAT